MAPPLLAVEDLTTVYRTDEGVVSAVDGVSFTLAEGETLGVVGESGCGKSATVRSVLGLVRDPGEVVEGSVRWRGDELVDASPDRLREVRGAGVGFAFQNARAAFDPTYPVGDQLVEAVRAHDDPGRRAARDRARALLDEVGIPDPASRMADYPHEYSGGMLQRANVAMALAGDPDLLVADEPTTGLDVSVQATLLDLFDRLVDERDMALVFISHDVAAVSQVCARLLVMYAGRVAERGPREQVLSSPGHPYTQLFLASVPDVDGERPLRSIPGSPPDLTDPPSGCRFRDRCPASKPVCAEAPPPAVDVGPRQAATCYGYVDEYGAPPDGARDAGVSFDD